MFCGCDNAFNDTFPGSIGLPPRRKLDACGYDPECYISTAGLSVTAYTNSTNIIGRIGGNAQFLIPATDDNNTGDVDQAILNSIIANVTTEINGLISSIYPIPLQQIGTVCILQVATVTTDGTGGIATINVIEPGAYLTAPASPNSAVYLRALSVREKEEQIWNTNNTCQQGTGASFTVTFNAPTKVTPQTPITVTGTPTITAAGTKYQVGDLLVLVGGSSFVPDKITNAATTLVCYDMIRRRLSPHEVNMFAEDTKAVKKELLQIGNGELVLDGTYRNFFSPIAAWVQQSVLIGNSL